MYAGVSEAQKMAKERMAHGGSLVEQQIQSLLCRPRLRYMMPRHQIVVLLCRGSEQRFCRAISKVGNLRTTVAVKPQACKLHSSIEDSCSWKGAGRSLRHQVPRTMFFQENSW